MEIKNNILELIGETPMMYLDRFSPDPAVRIAAKLEMFNPSSVKDRPVLYMIQEAERRGEIHPGRSTIIEASSGNTAIAVAYICALKNYQALICMPEHMSEERKRILRALGAKIELTPKEEHTRGSRARAIELSNEIEDSFYLCQHDNPDNFVAHYETTAREILRQTEGRLDVFIAGLGTTGTLRGVAERIKESKPAVRFIGIEPKSAPMISKGCWASHRLAGTSPGFIPKLLRKELIDETILVSVEEAYAACRELAKKEGVLVGITSGACAHAARLISKRPESDGGLIVCIFADSGERYLTVEGMW
jgi:cysteine synthase A